MRATTALLKILTQRLGSSRALLAAEEFVLNTLLDQGLTIEEIANLVAAPPTAEERAKKAEERAEKEMLRATRRLDLKALPPYLELVSVGDILTAFPYLNAKTVARTLRNAGFRQTLGGRTIRCDGKLQRFWCIGPNAKHFLYATTDEIRQLYDTQRHMGWP